MKITIPHIHKIEGEAGFWARVTKEGKVEELKFQTLLGLRQIEGILIGRRFFEVPMVVSRICGICPVVHILNACCALEKALGVKVSDSIILLRKLFLASQIIQSHALHLFFNTLADFFDIENDLDLMKKFPKETKAALKIRDFSLEITQIIGGRKVHPITPQIGGFSKLPEKEDLKKILNEIPFVIESAEILAKTFSNLEYPRLERKTVFASLFTNEDYSFYQAKFIKSDGEISTPGDFYSNEIEEDLKILPVKRVKYRGGPYMLGAIARMKNNSKFLNPLAKKLFEEFKKKNNLSEKPCSREISLQGKEFFENIFHNLFCQAIEVLHFLEETQKILKEILKEKLEETKPEFKIQPSSGLSAMEAPRGTLFTYFELDKQGRILNCNIITPTTQFLNNLEADLKVFLPQILKLPKKEKIRKIRSLVRVYDPCISCATH